MRLFAISVLKQVRRCNNFDSYVLRIDL